MLRTARLLSLLAVAAALFAPVAAAADPPPVRPLLPYSHTSAHFVVHYSSDPQSDAAITQTDASDLAARAELAYELALGWGFPPPLDDGDGLIDIYVASLEGTAGDAFAIPDGAGLTTSGSIDISPTAISSLAVVAHELFHLIQLGMWFPNDFWILEATAEWAGAKAESFPSSAVGSVPFEMSLDCVDPFQAEGHTRCALSPYDNGGYSRWPLFQFLAERFGPAIVKDIFLAGATTGSSATPPVTAMQNALNARGTTVADVFNDWSVVNMTGGYEPTSLKALAPVPVASVAAGTSNGLLPPTRVTVDHLAARYVAFTRGGGSPSAVCYEASLTLNVALPFGVAARPHLSWERGPAVPLSVTGSQASVTVPWDTCTTPGAALLSLPNPSLSVDGAAFTVTGSLTVDKTRIASPTAPKPGGYTGPTVPAPDVEEPPAIALYGPETLRVSKRRRVVRLVVFASGEGSVAVRLGTVSLGRKALRAGNNDLRFTLPVAAARRLAATSTLWITSQARDGTVGETIARRLVLTK